MKDFMTLYSGLVERCFMDCANDFTTTKLKAGEESCVNHCADKFLALSTRCVKWIDSYLVLLLSLDDVPPRTMDHPPTESDQDSQNTTQSRCRKECNKRIEANIQCITIVPSVACSRSHTQLMYSMLQTKRKKACFGQCLVIQRFLAQLQ